MRKPPNVGVEDRKQQTGTLTAVRDVDKWRTTPGGLHSLSAHLCFFITKHLSRKSGNGIVTRTRILFAAQLHLFRCISRQKFSKNYTFQVKIHKKPLKQSNHVSKEIILILFLFPKRSLYGVYRRLWTKLSENF